MRVEIINLHGAEIVRAEIHPLDPRRRRAGKILDHQVILVGGRIGILETKEFKRRLIGDVVVRRAAHDLAGGMIEQVNIEIGGDAVGCKERLGPLQANIYFLSGGQRQALPVNSSGNGSLAEVKELAQAQPENVITDKTYGGCLISLVLEVARRRKIADVVVGDDAVNGLGNRAFLIKGFVKVKNVVGDDLRIALRRIRQVLDVLGEAELAVIRRGKIQCRSGRDVMDDLQHGPALIRAARVGIFLQDLDPGRGQVAGRHIRRGATQRVVTVAEHAHGHASAIHATRRRGAHPVGLEHEIALAGDLAHAGLRAKHRLHADQVRVIEALNRDHGVDG